MGYTSGYKSPSPKIFYVYLWVICLDTNITLDIIYP